MPFAPTVGSLAADTAVAEVPSGDVDAVNCAAELAAVDEANDVEIVGNSTLLTTEYVVDVACTLMVTVTVAVAVSGLRLAAEDTSTLELVELFVYIVGLAEGVSVVIGVKFADEVAAAAGGNVVGYCFTAWRAEV